MKNIARYLLLSIGSLSIFSCNQSEKTETKNLNKDSIVVSEKAKISDFQSAKDVDNINNVPFIVFSKLDSVTLFTEAKANSKSLKIENSKLSTFYGFEDLNDFFLVNYPIQYNPNKTIIAYVSKKEFVKDSQLSLRGQNLNEIRSSTLKGIDNFDNKSFEKYGKVSQIDAETYNQARSLNEKINPNTNMHYDGKTWQLGNLKIEKTEQDEEAEYHHQYIGFLSSAQLEIFLQEDSYSDAKNYIGYHSNNPVKETYFLGFPAVDSAKKRIACINKNSDVGSDFSLTQYNPQTQNIENTLYVNFTNFKVIDSQSLIWVNSKTLYFKGNNTNTKTTDPNHITEYLKIELLD